MMVSSVVVFENYAASYTAFLAVVKLAVPFTSVRDMYRSTDYRIGAPVGTAYKQLLIGVSREPCKAPFDSLDLSNTSHQTCDSPCDLISIFS